MNKKFSDTKLSARDRLITRPAKPLPVKPDPNDHWSVPSDPKVLAAPGQSREEAARSINYTA
jgi:hypothetical protein